MYKEYQISRFTIEYKPLYSILSDFLSKLFEKGAFMCKEYWIYYSIYITWSCNAPDDILNPFLPFIFQTSVTIETKYLNTGGPRLVWFQLVRSPIQYCLQTILNSTDSPVQYGFFVKRSKKGTLKFINHNFSTSPRIVFLGMQKSYYLGSPCTQR